ncbi:E3 ubiquitin-protein ligase TRIM71-like [Ostrea edulis]|uniref:E3 ubiquitin-protein ligase TRIM71-like n=1 Tax=Ostrea edulis TaxID=37623 RepID=UPI0024AEF9C9|nr:E3 ubiquitin-protein ligase TRIM71-like [Ostrea edulis]
MMDPRTSAQDVMRCDLCETALVQMYCDTCFVSLCKACVGEHMISDELRKHDIITFQFRKSAPLYPDCASHDKERCEMYCSPCRIPVCHTCLASNQHLSHKLLKILQVLEETKEKIAKEKTELNETISPAYQDIVSDVQNRMRKLEKKYGNISTAITKHGEEWHKEIDKLVQKLKSEVEEMKTTQLHTLQKHLDEVNKNISDINDEINSIDVALGSNDMSKVFNLMPNVEEYKKLPQKILPSSPKFTPGKLQEELCQLFGTLSPISVRSEEHGYSIKTTEKSQEAASSSVIKQLLDEPQIVTTIYTGYNLRNVACLSDEEIWTHGNSSTMKLFSIYQGSRLKSIATKSGNTPGDLVVTNSGDLVYTDYHDRTVNIVKNEQIQTVIRLKNWNPRGVCSTFSDGLLVIMSKKVQTKVVHYSGSTETQTIQFDDQSRPLYSPGDIKYINENKNQDICVADGGATAVVVVNQAGKLRFRYTGHTPAPKNKPFNPRGITTDSQSHILTADYYNHCVHIIDQNGQFLRYIYCGQSYPQGLSIDTNDNLFVAQCSNKQVKKIKYQQ